MAGTCALTAPPDLFRVCNKSPWAERKTHLRFVFAGKVVGAVAFQAMLDAPFTLVKDDDELPPPEGFPPGAEVARVYSCPIAPTDRAITLEAAGMRYISAQYRHFYIDLGGSSENYLQKFSSKSRSTLKRKVKKFVGASGLAQPLREYKRPGEIAEFHRLAAQGWWFSTGVFRICWRTPSVIVTAVRPGWCGWPAAWMRRRKS